MSEFMGGSVVHQLDSKNRIRIPAKYRPKFPQNEKLYFVCYNAGYRIAVMSESVLKANMALLKNILPGDEEGTLAMSKIFSSVDDVVEDNQGRAIIPRTMREAAEIDKDVVTAGMGDYIEIWAKHMYEKLVASLTVGDANKIAYKIIQDKKQ